MELLPTIGNRIRLFRTAKGLTQENIAEMLEMSVSWYAKVERGEIDLSISHIEQIAKIHNLSAGDLLKIAENQNIFNNSVNNINGAFNNSGSMPAIFRLPSRLNSFVKHNLQPAHG